MIEHAQKRMNEDEAFRNAICDWLTANDINPKNVPIDAKASIADGMLTIPMYVTDENGRHQIDPSDQFNIQRNTVTVPLKVPPTPEVELWLAPICPTCGR